jgi:hypothetical protein
MDNLEKRVMLLEDQLAAAGGQPAAPHGEEPGSVE